MMNVAKARAEYYGRGFTVLENVAPRRLVAEWRQKAMDLTGSANRRDTDDGIVRHYSVLDGNRVQREFPSLFGAYAGWQAMLRAVLGEAVEISIYDRSGVNVRVYHGAGAEHGWHLDTQPITALLYLTTHADEGATEVHPADNPEGPVTALLPVAGSMLLMQGRRCLHRAAPISGKEPRIAVPLNYYTETDFVRDASLDVAHYGDMK